ncbi:hypothetical protein AYI69_g7972, partial [Smittium culicis]
MYEEIREGGRSVLAGATKTLEEETSTAGNHQVIGRYVEMLGRKRKRGTEVDEGARHKLTKHDVYVMIRSLVHHLPRKSADSNAKHAVEASDNGKEGRANRKRANPFVFIEKNVEFIKRKLELVRETGAKTSTMISSDPDSLSVCGMIDECDAPSVYQTMSRFDFRDGVGRKSTSQRIFFSVVMVQESLVKRDDWAVTIPGYDFFHYCAREGSNHGVLLDISKGHVAQRIPGIEGKLVVAQAQLNKQTINLGLFYLPCNSTTERALNKRKILELLQTWSFDNLEEPCIIAGDINMSNSALVLLLKRHNTGYTVVDFSGSSKSFFGNGDKTWSSIDHIIAHEAAKGLFSNARVNRGYNISDHWPILGSLL